MNCLCSFIILLLIFYANGLIYKVNKDHTIRIHDIKAPKIYIVEENQPLSIYFDDFSVTHGWCYNYYDHDPILENTLPSSVDNSCIYFKNVTSSMSTLWQCIVAVDNSSMGKIPVKTTPKMYHVQFNLHVRAAKRVRMTINNQHINFTYNNKTSRYDGYANYIFVENESIYATCLNAEEKGKVQLIYSKTVSFLGVKSKAVFDSTSLTISLHVGLNNSYLDCEYISVEPNDKYIYRVYFITEYVPSNLTQLYTNSDSFNIFIILGCISGLSLIITIVGIVYWRKRQRPTKDTETPYNDLQNENEVTPIPESMYDSCFSENFSDIQPNNDVPGSSDNFEPYYHSYEKVNYSQCKPKLDEPQQQRASKIYNEPYDHFRRHRNKK